MRFLILIILLLSNFLWAGGGDLTGNGGEAMVCRSEDGRNQFVELFDFFENKYMRNIKLEPSFEGTSNKTTYDIQNKVLEHLTRLSPLRAKSVKNQLDVFPTQTIFLKKLPTINDSGSLIIDVGPCKIEQLAVQAKYNNKVHYFINRTLWGSLNNMNRVGLYFHEILYREALNNGHSNSLGARYLNAVIFSEGFTSMTRFDFFHVLIDSKFDVEWGGAFWKVSRLADRFLFTPKKAVKFPMNLEDTSITIKGPATPLDIENLPKLGLQKPDLEGLKSLPTFLILDSNLKIIFATGSAK